MRSWLKRCGLRQIRRAIVTLIGFTVILVGIAMLVLPGPAMLVIPLGLGILATEFLWARRWLEKMKQKAKKIKNGLQKNNPSKEAQ